MSVRIKLMLGIMGIAFLASGATGSYFYWQAKSAMMKSIQQELQSAAVIGARFVNGKEVQALQEPEHSSTPTYRRLQRLMGDLAQSTPEFLYAYIMRMHEGRVEFVVDSPPSDDDGDGRISEDEMPAPIGELYPDPPQDLLQGFVMPSVDRKPWKDQWGWTLSGYAPITTDTGRQVGLLGIDMSANRIRDKLANIRRAGLVSLGLALSLALVLTWFLSRQILYPVHSLQTAMQAVANGDLGQNLPVVRRDEFGRLMQLFNHMIQGLREKEILKKSLGKVMDRTVVDRLLSDELKLGGEVVEVSILFCDLRNFTALCTKLPPHLLVSLLNEYFTLMVREVESKGGMVDKFVGDSIMAVFEHPAGRGSDPDAAVEAALAMLEECDRLNAKRHLKGEFALKNSIGLHRGAVVAGNIGSPERMEYTCIGDAVNVAAQLEKSTRELDTRLAVSEEFRSRLTRTAHLFPSSREIQLKGRKQSIGVSVVDA
ncbi:MAG: adenylate/guanylate cyclase domain-containing protein [Desulfovermiculus sp.]|nr:adenylate/guanylate cyclase domain-containing protein [Desulfovermiculus sp.]